MKDHTHTEFRKWDVRLFRINCIDKQVFLCFLSTTTAAAIIIIINSFFVFFPWRPFGINCMDKEIFFTKKYGWRRELKLSCYFTLFFISQLSIIVLKSPQSSSIKRSFNHFPYIIFFFYQWTFNWIRYCYQLVDNMWNIFNLLIKNYLFLIFIKYLINKI
jgi:hypothetical protein